MTKETRNFIFTIIGLALLILILRVFIFTPVLVKGSSMDPTLADGERVIALLNSKLERFDIVTFPAPDNDEKNYVKRIIGLPGDSIRYENDVLYINDKEVDEPYLKDYKSELTDGMPLTYDFSVDEVPEGQFLVLGDNRRVSKDSREIGYIDEKKIVGDVVFCFWPPSKIGTVK